MEPKKEINPDNQSLLKSGYFFRGDKSIAKRFTPVGYLLDYLKLSASLGNLEAFTSDANSLAPLKSSALKFR